VKSTKLKYTSLIKIIILEENFKCHLEAFASELFIYRFRFLKEGLIELIIDVSSQCYKRFYFK